MTMDAMPRIDRASLMTLETYARERPQFRAKVIAHKKHRTVHLGEHVTVVFEDELTIRYQVQEMLRHERVWAIADEDLDRENGQKTSAVHFLRFELDEAAAQALKKGAGLTFGIDHPRYSATVEAPSAVRDSLVRDLG